MARPKAKYKNTTTVFSLPPLMKARLDAQAMYESEQSYEEVSQATIIRSGLEMYLREKPLPDGYFKRYIESIEDEKKRPELLQLLAKQSGSDNVLYKP